mgnify:FL=1
MSQDPSIRNYGNIKKGVIKNYIKNNISYIVELDSNLYKCLVYTEDKQYCDKIKIGDSIYIEYVSFYGNWYLVIPR